MDMHESAGNHDKYMELAIAKTKEGINKGQTPFGACIVKDGKVVACAHNTVWGDTDITAHAEINAIREACRVLKTIDLSGSVIYSTCEPCPMCFSAIHWARIGLIVYGASIADAKAAGFNELEISNHTFLEISNCTLRVIPNIREKECIALFGLWKKKPHNHAY